MKTIKDPAILLAQFTDDESRFNSMDEIAGWAVLEWEFHLKHPEDDAREGAEFSCDQLIRVTDKAFDDFADAAANDATNKHILSIS